MKILIAALLFGLPFFFFGGPGAHGSRSFVALWNLGHVLFFFLASLCLVKYFQKHFPDRTLSSMFFKICLIVLIFGVGIECLQMFSGNRSPDIFDVLRNQLGCLIAFVCIYSDKGYKKILFRCVVFVLIAIALTPLIKGGTDEWIARSQFPVLSDFETSYEENRWNSKSSIRKVKGISRHGNWALRVQLTTDEYSGVSLKYFQGDWRAFSNLFFSIYLPDDEPLEITCRVHDSAHDNQYSDRFNRRFVLGKGWNDLVISLDEVEKSPKGRLLNFEEVESFGFFVMAEERNWVVYLDSVYLE